ncbi:hypothetical protein [Pigmentiphaga litoralis]|uniref:Uncharacterized protein n=1 Tax=Pigmentiphaga litoralis TaxID=516702 RepID=A0A7Y9ITE3_9BURK|nr:hypothetical protein [Pigmentiphaga litoralis]NYE23700.1 hypothetical protein [Pigmentiphaga litoralis]NYE82686.1 hypothetical protein [Pigmentiphaga litoralis]
MLKLDTTIALADPVGSFDGAAPRCVGNIRSTAAIDQDVSRLLDLACAEQAAVVSHKDRYADFAHDPSRLWLPDEPSVAANPHAAILTAPVWDEAADRLIPQGCCLVEDDPDHQVKLTWRYGPNRHTALLSKDTYQRLLDSGTIVE